MEQHRARIEAGDKGREDGLEVVRETILLLYLDVELIFINNQDE